MAGDEYQYIVAGAKIFCDKGTHSRSHLGGSLPNGKCICGRIRFEIN